EMGVEVIPVWNKSNREHNIVHSEPASVRAEADSAVRTLNWRGQYFVDADHIGLKTVDRFLGPSDFFTIDVADFIGKEPEESSLRMFVESQKKLVGSLKIEGISGSLDVTAARVEGIAKKYLFAVQEAGKVYRYIAAAKGGEQFVAEVSMDETDAPQTPVELLFILSAMGQEKIPLQTIAPKFTGRFNKGVDYVGDLSQFEKEFNDDLAVIAYAIEEFGLPANLKLSVHSGSDKFSLYPIIHRALKKTGAGLHLKTAGTTWLEELIGLASAGGEGLMMAKQIYAQALARMEELCTPYASVIDIDKAKLPSPGEVAGWSGEQFAKALRHDQKCREYNPHFRQLLHVGFKVAAALGDRYIDAVRRYEDVVAKNVSENIFDRHLRTVFIGK
ncbi:MAG TPA: tagaturonate epimerase family protein, partial [Tepidisphaeraceae bacterium]|nr:tagaturonate epimerase family protein [Tepidisphaeraceae bacterium]